MIQKRLMKEVPEALKYVKLQVLIQWISLLANAAILYIIISQIQQTYARTLTHTGLMYGFGSMLVLLGVKMVCASKAMDYSHKATSQVKNKMRRAIYTKLLGLKQSYQTYVSTSELVQLSNEGVDQLEIYFGRYLPQFFYSLLAPITLFFLLVWIEWRSALVLFIFVPLIPISIIVIQKFAKRLLSKYWGIYTNMGDRFLDNLQGLTTLKIYQADAQKHQAMNEEAQRFRSITMKVLTMQLNSVSVMDIIAYGGTALGSITAVSAYASGSLSLSGVILIILLSSEFFLPLRLLGSYFHIAMNGMAASDKIFKILDIEEALQETKVVEGLFPIHINDLSFAYQASNDVLKNVHMKIAAGMFIGICGMSGSGKSTLAKVLCGAVKEYRGSITINNCERNVLDDKAFWKHATYVSHQGFVMKGSIRDNLRMGNPQVTDAQCWSVLRDVKLDAFIAEQDGLESDVSEGGANLSGGQRQRLVLARALLKNSDLYVFDEATSNIDSESEQAILDVILRLKGYKTVVMITHRLRSLMPCDHIYLLDCGVVTESGNHEALMKNKQMYSTLFEKQQTYEVIRGGEADAIME